MTVLSSRNWSYHLIQQTYFKTMVSIIYHALLWCFRRHPDLLHIFAPTHGSTMAPLGRLELSRHVFLRQRGDSLVLNLFRLFHHLLLNFWFS